MAGTYFKRNPPLSITEQVRRGSPSKQLTPHSQCPLWDLWQTACCGRVSWRLLSVKGHRGTFRSGCSFSNRPESKSCIRPHTYTRSHMRIHHSMLYYPLVRMHDPSLWVDWVKGEGDLPLTKPSALFRSPKEQCLWTERRVHGFLTCQYLSALGHFL